ncbi:MAG: hypothetical protein VYC34_01240, partial [Planctomycetota bacterium]|nr:hypothetical protein [Planctomycetota bacterium]
LKKHQRIGNWIQFDRIWTGYEQYLDDVRNTVPHLSRLRDKDRYLWGRSAACQLERDLANGFAKASKASG